MRRPGSETICPEQTEVEQEMATTSAAFPAHTAAEVTAGSLVFLNMAGSDKKEFKSMKPPVALAFVRSVEDGGKWNINWFSLGSPNFKLANKFQTWNKFWTDPNWPKKEGLKAKQVPTTAQIFKYWSSDEADPETMVQILIPPDLYTTNRVIQSDTIRLPTTLITEGIMALIGK